MLLVCAVAPNGFDVAPNTSMEGLCKASGVGVAAGGPDGLPKTFVVAGAAKACVGAPNGLEEGLGVPNGLLGVSVFADAKGLNDVVAGAPNGEDVPIVTNGFEGAGEGDLLGMVSSFLSAARGSANRTCLLLNVAREFPLPPLPFTVAPFRPLSCSRFAAFSSRSSSKPLGEFSVGDVPE
jgi:hypothetical protein